MAAGTRNLVGERLGRVILMPRWAVALPPRATGAMFLEGGVREAAAGVTGPWAGGEG
jgi:hypothetical protein